LAPVVTSSPPSPDPVELEKEKTTDRTRFVSATLVEMEMISASHTRSNKWKYQTGRVYLLWEVGF
jgi:hypothetical protein